MTQTEMILEHLKQGGKLTFLDALQKFNCARIGARAWDLRKQGHDVRSRMIELPSGKRVAQYYLYKEMQRVFA